MTAEQVNPKHGSTSSSPLEQNVEDFNNWSAANIVSTNARRVPLPGFKAAGYAVSESGTGNTLIFSQEDVVCGRENRIMVAGNNNNIVFAGRGKFSGCRLIISGNNNYICVGESFDLDHTILQVAGSNCCLLVGRNFRSNAGSAILSKENGVSLIIGDDCLFSTNISIRTSDNHGIFDLSTRKRINFAKNINIASRVWIGEDAKVLKGVSIGSDSIVGAAAVVTRDVPNNVAVAGNPARVVRDGIFWFRHFNLPKGG